MVANCFGTKKSRSISYYVLFIPRVKPIVLAGCRPSDGVPDMTVISDIDERGINENLHVRYGRDQIYVSAKL